jgi:Tol biopolymer transport system component
LPGNEATAEFYQLEAAAERFLYGVVWTATPTALFANPTPAPTYTATPGYAPVPQDLVGKIAFMSDRAGSKEDTGLEPQVYVMDGDGSNVILLSNRAVYDTALARDSFSADQRYRAYVEDFLRFDGKRVPGLYYQDSLYAASEQLTRLGAGIAWMPAWSPTREQIAFVSNETKDDEIWIIDRDGSNLRQLTAGNTAYNAENMGKDNFIPQVSRHPSWSPDGQQIVFWTNNTGNAQIWLMDADGGNQRNVSNNGYNDWNPVWIKYVDVPPLIPGPTPERRNPFDQYE